MAKHGSQWTKNMSPTKAPCQYTCHGGPPVRIGTSLGMFGNTKQSHPSPRAVFRNSSLRGSIPKNRPFPPPPRPPRSDDIVSSPFDKIRERQICPSMISFKRCSPKIDLNFWRALPHPLAEMSPKGSCFAPRRGRPALGLY